MKQAFTFLQKCLFVLILCYLAARAFFLCFDWKTYAIFPIVNTLDGGNSNSLIASLGEKAWDQKLGKLDPVTRKFIEGTKGEESLFQWSRELYLSDPQNRIYLANYTVFLIQEVLDGNESRETFFEAIRRWKQLDPDNAMPYLYAACMELKLGMKELERKYDKDPYTYSILDQAAVNRGIKEYQAGLKKKYSSTYSQESLKFKLQRLNLENTPLGIMQRIIVSARELLPNLNYERDLARRLTFLAKEFHRTGNQKAAKALVRSGRDHILLRLKKDDHILITLLVQNAVCGLWLEAAVETGDQEMTPVYQKASDHFQAWRKKEDPNGKNIARYAGILSSMILPALRWEIPISYYEPERMVNYLILDQLALGLFFGEIMLAVVLFLILTLAYLIRHQKPEYQILSPKAVLKSLLFGLILPFAGYLLLTHVPILSGRELNLMNNIQRSALQFLYFLAIPVWMTVYHFLQLKGEGKDRCLSMIPNLIISLFLAAFLLHSLYQAEIKHYIASDKILNTEFGFSAVETQVTKDLAEQLEKNLTK